jgi:hypothetical protein
MISSYERRTAADVPGVLLPGRSATWPVVANRPAAEAAELYPI